MLAVSIDIPAAELNLFKAALARYTRETRRDMRSALRSSTIDLVKALRARTRKSPKTVNRADIRWGESSPKYLTADNGQQFRRVVVTRWIGGRKVRKIHWQPVGVKYRARKTSNGIRESWSEATPAMLREARKRYGKIRQWGLAKKSWGWFMKALFKKSVADENPAAVIDSRMVDGGIREARDRAADGSIDLTAPVKCEVTIVNRLEYIRKAMHPGALTDAVGAAVRSITFKIENGLKSRRFGT